MKEKTIALVGAVRSAGEHIARLPRHVRARTDVCVPTMRPCERPQDTMADNRKRREVSPPT